ncbi:MAG: 30S ribosomal protein S14 [Candidatus Kapabacteria bacterium]|nr:30S ribosomal protein S14 [Ignavibacteriota bacterium]MCW5884033.1 30S ribosomal protein S14 [Candidatus Kapabacteria bacterium]
MSKTSVTARNEKRRRLIAKYAEKRQLLKANGDLEGLQKLPRNSSPTRLRSRCALTGRGRAVYRKFGLCRNVFRQMALEGKIPGVRKASW